ncbi:MAG: hypothetical protein RIF46_06850, partial [Cyclobacteriaceae bacterium]
MSQAAAQKQKINDLGAVLSYEEIEFGIEGSLENGQFKVTSYNPKVIRVQLSGNPDYDTNPYSVIANPSSNFSQISAGDD